MTTNNKINAEFFIRLLKQLNWLRNSPPFMDPKGSLPCLFASATTPSDDPYDLVLSLKGKGQDVPVLN